MEFFGALEVCHIEGYLTVGAVVLYTRLFAMDGKGQVKAGQQLATALATAQVRQVHYAV